MFDIKFFIFKITHIRTIRHIFISIMIVLALHVIFSDLMDKGKIDLNFDLIRWCFGNFSVVFYTWLYMMLSTSCLVYYCFHNWATNRLYYLAKNQLRHNMHVQLKMKQESLRVDGFGEKSKNILSESCSINKKDAKTQEMPSTPQITPYNCDEKNHLVFYDFIWLIVYIIYLIGFIIFPAYISLASALPPASAMTLIIEQVRYNRFFLN
jgi:hypothetical protein